MPQTSTNTPTSSGQGGRRSRVHCNTDRTDTDTAGGPRPQGPGGVRGHFSHFFMFFGRFRGREAFQRVPGGRSYLLTKYELKRTHLDLIHLILDDFSTFFRGSRPGWGTTFVSLGCCPGGERETEPNRPNRHTDPVRNRTDRPSATLRGAPRGPGCPWGPQGPQDKQGTLAEGICYRCMSPHCTHV